MKFKCEKAVLYSAVKASASAVSNVSLPVEQNVKLVLLGKNLTVSGNDSIVTIKTNLVVDGKEDGSICLHSKTITAILDVLAHNSEVGAVTVSDQLADNKNSVAESKTSALQVSVSGGQANFSIPQLPAGDFTPHSMDADAPETKLKAKALLDAIKQIITMAATNERRQVLTGVLIENDEMKESKSLKVVASDTFRLGISSISELELPTSDQKSVLVPVSSLNRLIALVEEDEEMTIKLEGTQVSFEVGTTTLISQLLAGEFPEYNNLIPTDYPNKLTVNNSELAQALKTVSVFAREDANELVRAKLTKDKMILSAAEKSRGFSQEEIKASFDGEDLSIGFNARFLGDALKSMDDKEVIMSINGAFKPIFIEGKTATNFKCLLMPVRLSTDTEPN